jgi:peptide-methionine (S)-S-oxide reductase
MRSVLPLAVLPLAFAFVLAACHSTRSSDATSSAHAPTNANAPTEPNAMKPTKITANPDPSHVGTSPGNAGAGTPLVAAPGHALAGFAEGCFWGSEETFRHVSGVTATAVGYTGGHTKNPTYESVCTHTTGHAETVLVEFDPKIVSYEQLLEVFWRSHDPTQGNRQGPDVGDQYRSAVWTFDDAQTKIARASMASAQKELSSPITTEIAPMRAFWIAEDYHQQYDEKNGGSACGIGLPKGI